jgi:hypothetical protein
MSSSDESPMQWNNHAVLLLEMGRPKDARLLFKQALEILGVEDNRIVKRYSPIVQNESDQPPPKMAFTGWSRTLVHACFVDGVFVYCRAVSVHPIFHESLFEIYAAAIMFNLGLTQHILALEDGSSSNYKKSRQFYANSMNLLQQDVSSNFSPEKDILRALLLNNSGHIFYTAYMDSEGATQCFTAVCGLVMDAEQSNPDESGSIDEGDVTGLLSNVLFQMATTAPAA